MFARLAAAVAAALLFWTPAAGEIRIEPESGQTEPLRDVELVVHGVDDQALAGCQVIAWPDEGLCLRRYRDWGNRPILLFEAQLPGTYRIVLVAPKSATETERADCEITVAGPDPPGPDPPDPTPGPLRVMLLYEETPGSMTLQQRAVLTSSAIRKYLQSHCQQIDGQPAFRFLDQHADTADLPAALRSLFDAAVSSADSLPWIVADNGADRFDGPAPPNIEATLGLLKRYGGD